MSGTQERAKDHRYTGKTFAHVVKFEAQTSETNHFSKTACNISDIANYNEHIFPLPSKLLSRTNTYLGPHLLIVVFIIAHMIQAI